MFRSKDEDDYVIPKTDDFEFPSDESPGELWGFSSDEEEEAAIDEETDEQEMEGKTEQDVLDSLVADILFGSAVFNKDTKFDLVHTLRQEKKLSKDFTKEGWKKVEHLLVNFPPVAKKTTNASIVPAITALYKIALTERSSKARVTCIHAVL
jgi:hypothetical protein